jgi:hypothetical protein
MFRHTSSMWLEDVGIPTRVIAELMGHRPGGTIGRISRAAPADHNAVTAGYTHTTPAMLSRVLAAIEVRLKTAFAAAAKGPPAGRRRAAAPTSTVSAATPDRPRTGPLAGRKRRRPGGRRRFQGPPGG